MNLEKEPFYFNNQAEWRSWLAAHYAEERQAWLVFFKKGVREGVLTYEQAVEEALCFGWIDGLLRSLDAERFILRFSPRRRRSVWSESNKRRVEKLIREGRMTDAGLVKVAQARESGEWEAATQREDVDTIPPQLERALRRHKGAIAAYRNLPPSQKKQYTWWVTSAKKDETRQKRIQAIIDRVTNTEQA